VSRRAVAAAAALAVLAGLAVAATWPFALHPGTTLTAPIGYDVSGSVAKFAAIVREGTTPFSDGRLTSIAVPGGIALTPGLDAASLLSSLTLWWGTAAIGAIATHGFMTLLGLFLSGAVAFALVRALTGSAGAGLVAGIACGFFPHIRLLAIAAPTYTHVWLYLLPLWAFTRLLQAPGARRALLAGASALPAMFWTPYYTLQVLVELLACGIVVAVVLGRASGARATVRTLLTAALPVAAGVVAYLAIGLATAFSDVPERAATDLYAQSAHPLMYLLPGYAAWAWGERPYEALVDVVPRAADTNLYLGVSVMILAAVALVWLAREGVRRLPRAGRPGGPPDPVALAALLAGAVALAALVWSLPPTIGVAGVDVPLPSRITTELVPAARAGQRFVMLAMPALAVLAGIGTARLLRRVRGRGPAGAALAVALAAVVAVDLAAVPPERTTRVPRSAALAALAAAPPGVAMHYQNPIFGSTVEGRVARPCVYQIQHGHPLLNACNLTTDPAVLGRLADLNDVGSCAVIGTLRYLHVRYLILDAGVMAPHCGGRLRLRVLSRDDAFTVLTLG
jgi:hypothetical protein